MSEQLTKETKQFIHDEIVRLFGSRKGADGALGQKGDRGADSSVPGPQGQPGRDAKEIIIGSVVAGDHAFANLADQGRVYVLNLVLPRGERGADSTVPGPAGKDGETVVGPSGAPGKDAAPAKDGVDGKDAVVKIGTVQSGDTASVTVRQTTDGQVLDFVLPRGDRGETGADSVVPGPVGPKGERGEGADIVNQFEAFREEINKQVGQVKGQLELQLRRLFKEDVAAALRGHLAESHKN